MNEPVAPAVTLESIAATQAEILRLVTAIDRSRWLKFGVAKDAFSKETQNGGLFAKTRAIFTLANGKEVWGNLLAFDHNAHTIAALHKGDKGIVIGQWRKGKPWTNKQGEEVCDDEYEVIDIQVNLMKKKAAPAISFDDNPDGPVDSPPGVSFDGDDIVF